MFSGDIKREHWPENELTAWGRNNQRILLFH